MADLDLESLCLSETQVRRWRLLSIKHTLTSYFIGIQGNHRINYIDSYTKTAITIMATAAVPLVERAASTSPNRMLAVSKHLSSFLSSIISILSPSFFLLDLGYNCPPFALVSIYFSFQCTTKSTSSRPTTTTATMGLSDHCLTISGWGMTVAALGLALLGPIWSSIIFWVIRRVKSVCGLLFVC